MKLRVAASSGWPGDRSASWTTGGAVVTALDATAFRCSFVSSSALQLAQPELLPPHTHLRWSDSCPRDRRAGGGSAADAAGSGIRIT
jgi:hypothetical protein